jgi:hypothetical protein
MFVDTDCIVCQYAMLSKRHPELDPLGNDLRELMIYPRFKRIDQPWSSFDGAGDKDLVFLVDVIVESYCNKFPVV